MGEHELGVAPSEGSAWSGVVPAGTQWLPFNYVLVPSPFFAGKAYVSISGPLAPIDTHVFQGDFGAPT